MKNKLLKLAVGTAVFTPLGALASPQCDGVTAVGGDCGEAGLTGKITLLINTLFVVAGSVAVIILIMGGIRYITSTGDSKRIQAAKDTILYAVFGIIVIVLARAIVGFAIGAVT